MTLRPREKSEAARLVADLLSRYPGLDRNQLKATATWDDLGMDALDLLEMATAVSGAWDVAVDRADLAACADLGQALDMIWDMLSEGETSHE